MDKEQNKHLKFLFDLTVDAYHKKHMKVITLIEKYYIDRKVFEEDFYREADDFIFRMDVTGLSYSEIFDLSYEGLMKNDYKEYLLGLMIILSKLEGNQRYKYFDRDMMKLLMSRMASDNGLKPYKIEDDRHVFTGDCSKYMPIGMDSMDIGDYRSGSLLSRYGKYKTLNEKALEVEYQSAMKSGSIYHHIVETDHFINSDDEEKPREVWIHLIKLLTLQYATEKAGWTSDFTEDLLKAFNGLKNSCESEEFIKISGPLASAAIKVAVKRIMVLKQEISASELRQILNFLMNINRLGPDRVLGEYIDIFSKMLKDMGIDREILMVH